MRAIAHELELLMRPLSIATFALGAIAPLLILSACGPLEEGGLDAEAPIEEQASHRGNGSRSRGDVNAVSYINPDVGAATANPDVDEDSSCESPDTDDNQMLSPAGTTSNNVHNDACLFKGRRYPGKLFDGPASFVSRGVGVINACPDPDGAGPKVARLSDDDGDGRKDRCYQSGYQMKGTAGDEEFHARLNNDTTPGDQTVTFCYDPNDDGCRDAKRPRSIVIHWEAQNRSSEQSWGGWGR